MLLSGMAPLASHLSKPCVILQQSLLRSLRLVAQGIPKGTIHKFAGWPLHPPLCLPQHREWVDVDEREDWSRERRICVSGRTDKEIENYAARCRVYTVE